MSLQIVQFTAQPSQVGEVEEGIRTLFAALDAAGPAGIEYTAARVGDSSQFLLMLTLTDGAPNPLLAIPAAGEFRTQMTKCADGPVQPVTLHVLGRYTA